MLEKINTIPLTFCSVFLVLDRLIKQIPYSINFKCRVSFSVEPYTKHSEKLDRPDVTTVVMVTKPFAVPRTGLANG